MDFCFSSFPYWLLPFPNILIVKIYLFITRGFCHSFEFWLYLQASDGCKLFICLYLFRWLGHWLSFRICHFFCEIHLWHCWRNVSLYIFSRYGKQLYIYIYFRSLKQFTWKVCICGNTTQIVLFIFTLFLACRLLILACSLLRISNFALTV